MLKCGYCGRENPDQTQACSGCGTPFVDDSEAGAGGSKEGQPISAGGLIECAAGVAGLLGGHVPSIFHVIGGLSKLDAADDADSVHGLLERAALLESVDMPAALALYEQIVRDHAGTTAAKEASRNLKTLRAAHPGLG